MGDEDDWEVPDEIKQKKVLKPPFQTKVGRPKKNRRPSQGEKKKALHLCSFCGGQGHNHLICKYIMSAPSAVYDSDTRRVAQQVQI